MNGAKPFVSLDFDSVIARTDGMLRYGFSKILKLDPRKLAYCGDDGIRRFDYPWPDWYDQKNIYDDIAAIINEKGMEQEPTAWAIQCLRYIHEITGEPIHVLTARREDNMAVTSAWLHLHLGTEIPYELQHTKGRPKWEILNGVKERFNIFHVDDRFKTISQIADNCPTVLPVLFNAEWNTGRDWFDGKEVCPGDIPVGRRGYIRINDLRDIIPLVNMGCGLNINQWPCETMPHPVEDERSILEADF